jgi:uncharacterized protein
MRFAVIIEYTDLKERERALPAHREYLRAARIRGEVTESGPFADGRGGLYLLELADEAAARAFVEADPYRKAGMKLTLRLWHASREKPAQ